MTVKKETLVSDAMRKLQPHIAANWSEVPEIVRVLALSQKETTLIWTIIDTPNQAVRYRIYELERDLEMQVPGLDLDFRITNLADYPGKLIEDIDIPRAVVILGRVLVGERVD